MFAASTQFNRSTIPRFARRNGAVNFTSKSGPIALDDLAQIAPSVFAEEKHESRSDRYAYIPTGDVVRALVREGFQPYSVLQGGSRDEGKRGFTKHLIRFRHESTSLAVGGNHLEVCLLNSHDGTSAYKLFAGVFRLVCSNGLVVSEGDVESVRVPHKGDVTNQVVEGCVRVLGALPELNDRIERFSSLQLSAGEQRAFATAALVAKYGEKEAPFSAEKLLTPHRREDLEPTAWNTLNIVQENLIRGGVRYIADDNRGRPVRRTSRATNSVDGNLNINRAIWTLASELAKLKEEIAA